MPSDERQSTFATRLRVLRAQHPEMSQSAIADLVGVSQHAISRWELGKSEPRVAEIAKLCDAYGVSADYMIGRSESPTGLEPGMWIVDLDPASHRSTDPREQAAIEVPRRHKIMTRMEKDRFRLQKGR